MRNVGDMLFRQTEAMSVIDVNSGKNIARSKKQSDKEKAALKVNLEAAKEIISQMHLLRQPVWYYYY